MIEPVEPSSKQKLQERFSLSSRTAIRIGALWKQGLGISEGLLETAGTEANVERFLLSDFLLDRGGDLNPDELDQAVENELDEDEIPNDPVSLHQEEQPPVLCLEEELLAEDVFSEEPNKSEPASDQSDTLVSTSSTSDALSLLSKDASEPVFSDEQVNELKLTILTGVDPDEKIEALRKLAVAPVDEKLQSAVFIRALTDESSGVREEAARCLQQLGLQEELSDAIQTFLSGDLEQKQYAGEKLKHLVEECDEFEKAVVAALLTSELDSEEDADVHKLIVESFLPLADFLAKNAEEHLPALTRNLLKTLVSNFYELNGPVRELYHDLGSTVPKQVSDVLWDEVQKLEKRELKAYLLILLGECPAGEERKQNVAEEMATIIKDWSDTEIDCRRLGNALIRLEAAAANALIHAFPEAKSKQKIYLLRLLDELLIHYKPEGELRENLESFLLDVTEIEDRNLRESLLDLRLLYNVPITQNTKQTFARRLLEPLHRFKDTRIARLTPVVLEKIGHDVVPTLMNYLKDGTYKIQREAVLEVLGNLFSDMDPDGLDQEEQENVQQQIANVDEYIEQQQNQEEKDLRKQMIVTQARVLSSPLSDPDRAQEKLTELRENIEHSDEPYAHLEGLGWLASSPLIHAERAMEIGVSFLDYLDRDLPEDISQDHETEDGRTLFVQKESEAYTELIPAVLEGLTRICCREQLKESFRERVCSKLLDTWNDLVDFNLVWGPGTVTKLARKMGILCLSPHMPESLKEDLLDGLSRRVDNITVVKIIGDILGSGLESSKTRSLCRKITLAWLEMIEMPDYQDPEDRRVILENLGKVCSRRNIAGDRSENKTLRKKVIDALFDGLYDQIDGVRNTLEELSEHERVPKKYRNQIKQKLAAYHER